MNHLWTLRVRNFGPIQSADIDIHPFMMFVGPNNSGKSYLSTLIWGLLTHWKILLDRSSPENPAYKAFSDWLLQERKNAKDNVFGIENENEKNYVSHFGETEIELFIAYINESLCVRKKEFLKFLFNSEEIDAEEIRIISHIEHLPHIGNFIFFRDRSFFVALYNGSETLYTFPVGLTPSIIVSVIWIDLIKEFSRPLYLPSARTGFMLNFRTIASSTIGQGFSLQEHPKGLHTAATIAFLQRLIQMPKEAERTEYSDIVEWLEKEVISGNFVRKDDLLPDYYYAPHGVEEPLPLHVCSSLVTELAPLVLFLKAGGHNGSLIIEEPEAHLHPAAQRKVAQALVRLVNKGWPVWITTHSDIMFQQFNNLIALSHLPNGVEIGQSMGYEESDILNAKEAMAYQFIMTETGTIVQPLKQIETGFVAPSFIKTLSDLTAETIRLHDLLDEGESAEL